MHADYIFCFALSFEGLQDLVKACSKFAESHCIVFNTITSTKMMVHTPFVNVFSLRYVLLAIQYFGVFDNNDIMR